MELVEYRLLYADRVDQTAYYDTLADLAATMVGAVVDAGFGPAVLAWRRRGRR